MKNDFYRMKRLSVAWLIAGIVAFFMHLIPILVLVGGIYKFLFSLVPIGIAALTVAWRLTVKNARAVSSVLFLLLTLAVPALSGVLICYTTAIISLGGYAFMLLPLCMLVCLIVWYVLFFILRKQYSHLIGMKEETEVFYNEK